MLTKKLTDLTLHPDSRLVPAMRSDEYKQLLADIEARGITTPLDVDGTVVLDGRHRLKAARELGLSTVPVRAVVLDGETARDWLVKAAVLRRHLSDDQRAMMAALYAKQHPKPTGRPKKNVTPTGRNVLKKKQRAPGSTLAAGRMNVAPKRAEKAARVLKANPTLAAKVHRGEVKLAQAVRQVKQTETHSLAPTLEKPDGLFEVIVIDPPWQYDRQPGDSGMRGEVDYATMTLEELKATTLPAAADCVLWLWTTNSFMREAYDLLDAWGFTPKTILTWDKVHMGLGSWLRNVTEHCLVAVQGHPIVTLTNQTTLIRESRREHSRKPEAFYALVESLCPGRRYEHFSRASRPGWVGYGAESNRFGPSVSA